MARRVLIILLSVCILAIGALPAVAASVEYSSDLWDLEDSGQVFGQSITEWSGQGIFCDGYVNATLWRWSSGQWIQESGASDHGDGSDGSAVVHPEGFNSGSYYCETATHWGDFWDNTRSSESPVVLCP